MNSVIIECNDDIDALSDTLSMLVSGVVFGVVREVILVYHSHHAMIEQLAKDTGCQYLRDSTLKDAIQKARSEWLLFLPCGARLLDQWKEIIARHIESQQIESQHIKSQHLAATFLALHPVKHSFLKKIIKKKSVLHNGLLLPKNLLHFESKSEKEIIKSINQLKIRTLPVQIFLPI